MTGCAHEIPAHLITGSRQPQSAVPRDARLYRRVFTEHIAGTVIHYSAFDRPNASVNSSHLSDPDDVLIPVFLDAGVVELPVENLPVDVVDSEGHEVQLGVTHLPSRANYAHCEIRAQFGNTGPSRAKNAVWMECALKMAYGSRVIKLPGISLAEWRNVKDARWAHWRSHAERMGRPEWATLDPTAS